MAGANRKVEGDLGAHLLRWKARYGSFPESIEADKAQELWAAGKKWHIAMVPVPPYCYGPHGTIDIATRTARVLVQTALEELNLPKVLYKHVLDGICETWNKTYNKQIGMTPAEKHLGFPPVRTFMFGDQIVVKMNEKSLELAGVEVTYLHKENSHLATVLRRAPVLGKGTETHTVLEVHPAWLKPVRRGLNKPQEVGGAAAHGPGVAGLEVRGRVEGDGNGEGVEARKYSGIWAQTGRGGTLQPFIVRQENSRSVQVNEFDQTPAREARVGVVPPSASADAAAQPSGVNQEEEEWGRVKEELFGDRALEMKAEEGQVQEEGGAMLIAKQGQPTLPQTQSNRPSPPTKIPYSHRMLQWDFDVRRYSEEFGGDAPFLALASFRKGATMLPASREEIARGEFWEADVKEWAAILHTKTIGKRRSHLELAAVLNMGFARNHKEDLSKGPGGRKKKTRIYVAGYDDLRKVDTFSGTPNRDCFLLTLLYVATRGFEVELVDIKNAFLQSPDDHIERVGVRIPKSIPTMPAQKPSFLTEYSDAEWGEIRKEAERVVPGQIYE
eukprot:Cvel_29170.t1-p1 / transcript=Cvel_29170.t1 / gene=Cvel_29170 / organism=Chromera_velia_CCMP2878 / gene_product=hypothetical protein / transcript_product=hypothetical protein / location=Cvel_scaffold3947:10622-12578(+) / protein_length=555 / sequence_SO=supercontig / SO=protein_coding / is_pseudo=false